MSSTTKELQSVRSNVRAVLLASKEGLLLKIFTSEYRELVGEPIRHQRLGFGSVLDLLRSMPDTVQIFDNGVGGDCLLKAVPDKSTMHIAQMVQKQKSADNSSLAQQAKRAARMKANEAMEQMKKNQSKTRMLPRNVQQRIGDLIKKVNPRGVSIQAFADEYRRSYQEPLNYDAFGFKSLQDLFLGLKELVDLRQVGADEFMVRPKPDSIGRDKQRQAEAEEQRRQKNQSQNAPGRSATPSSSSVNQTHRRQNRPQTYGNSNQSSSSSASASASVLRLPPAMQTNLKRLIAQCPDGLDIYDLNKRFKAIHSYEFDFKNYGCQSINEFCFCLQDIFSLVKPDPKSHWILFPAAANGQSPSGASGDSQSVGSTGAGKDAFIPPDVKESVRKILVNFPQGIAQDKFIQNYIETTGRNLHPGQFGHKTLQSFLHDLDFVVVVAGSGGDWRKTVVRLASPGGAAAVTATMRPEAVVRPCASGDVAPAATAAAAADEEDGICREQQLPPDLCIGEYIEVVLGEVITPGRFYVILRGEKTSLALDRVMDDIDAFYRQPEADRYKMEHADAVVGQFCACLYDDMWHRARISRIKDISTVEVFYVDYGTKAKIKRDQLRHLHKKFCRLPAQAIQARLAKIRPKGNSDKWPLAASQRLLALGSPTAVASGEEGGLQAEFRGWRKMLSPQQHQMSLWLVDTCTKPEQDILINQVLLDEGLAEVDPEAHINDNFQQDEEKKLDKPDRLPEQLQPLRLPKFASQKEASPVSLPSASRPPPPPAMPPSRPHADASSAFQPIAPPPQVQAPVQVRPPPPPLLSPGLGGPPRFSPAPAPAPTQPPLSLHAANVAPFSQRVPVLGNMRLVAPMPIHPGHISPFHGNPLQPPPNVAGVALQQHQQHQQMFLQQRAVGASAAGAFQRPPPTFLPQPAASTAALPAADAAAAQAGAAQTAAATNNTSGSRSTNDTKSSRRIRPLPNMLRRVCLTDEHVVHIANLNGAPYVNSMEISCLFPKWKKRDLLAKMIELKKVDFQRRDVEPEGCSELFEQCLVEGVPGVESGENLVHTLKMYRLRDLPFMIKTFSMRVEPALIEAVEREVAEFDPSDAHWTNREC